MVINLRVAGVLSLRIDHSSQVIEESNKNVEVFPPNPHCQQVGHHVGGMIFINVCVD